MNYNLSFVIDEALPQAARQDCRSFFDNLLSGPSRPKFAQHVDARAEYFGGGYEAWRDIYSPFGSLEGAAKLSVWAVRSWPSRLALAFVCAERARWSEQSRIEVIDLPSVDLIRSICCAVPEKAEGREGKHRVLTAEEAEGGATFWNAFASAEPAVVLSSARMWPLLPKQELFSAFLTSVFPRRREGRIHLSEFDACLLSSAADQWVSAVDLFGSSAGALLPVRRLARCVGDGMLAKRLAAWSGHSLDEPALETTTDTDSPLFRSRYRLTSRGRSLLKGFADIREAPICVVGGTRAYDPDQPFFTGST